MTSVSEERKSGKWAHWWEVAGKTLLAGGVAGAVSRTVVAPFERLKIIFQTQGQPPIYTGVVQALQKIRREEGIRGYFKGNGVNCVRIFPTSALQFYCYETYKRMLLDHYTTQKDLTPLQRLYAGGMAGISALIFTYPLEFVRCRLTLQKSKIYKGIFDCMVQVTRKEGFFTLYRGLWPSILGVVPYVGVDFAAYETLRQYSPKQADGTVSGYITLINGAIAGTMAQTISYPMDLVRRRLQVQGFASDIAFADTHYKGITDAFIRIYRTEGILGFYRGLVPNFIKVVPAISVSFYVYESMKQLLKIPVRLPPPPPPPSQTSSSENQEN
jgi:solute carrier family 25 phosphate transporter 23/24/25/41